MSFFTLWKKSTQPNDAEPAFELALGDPLVAALVKQGYMGIARHISYEMALIEKGVPAKIKELKDRIENVRVEFEMSDYDGIGGVMRFAFEDTVGKFRSEEKARLKYAEYMRPIDAKRIELNPQMTPDIKSTSDPVELLATLRSDAETRLMLTVIRTIKDQPEPRAST